MKQKYIYCPPGIWEEEYNVWYTNVWSLLKSDQWLTVRSIMHDGHNHYISYTIDRKSILK